MIKCYISGQIGNLPEEEYLQNFAVGMEEVRAMNMQPVNPCHLPHEHDKSWQSYMKHDIIEMLNCDALYMLNNWHHSKGAKIEWQIAEQLGMQIFYQPENIDIKAKIIANICQHFKLTRDELSQKGNGVTAYWLPRQLCLYLLHNEAGYTYVEAGEVLNRTSGSSFDACLKIENKIRAGDKVVLGFLYKFGYKQGEGAAKKKTA